MITTKQYIFNEDLFDPLTYRNRKYSKIIKSISSSQIDTYVNKIIYLNSKGQIEKIEKNAEGWTAYAPGQKPPLGRLEFVDTIEYDTFNRVKQILRKPISDPNAILGKTNYFYEGDQLMNVRSSERKIDIIYDKLTEYEYHNAKLKKLTILSKLDDVVESKIISNFHWNREGQLRERETNIIAGPGSKFTIPMSQHFLYTYGKNNQLIKEEKNHSSVYSKEKVYVSFDYLNRFSDRLVKIETYKNGEALSIRDFEIDKKENIIFERIRLQNSNESVIKYKAY